MNYINQILFFFGAIGVFNCLIISLYFLISRSRRSLNNRVLGLFLLVLSLRILLSLFYAFSTIETVYIIQTGPFFFLLIGPLFLTYILSSIKSDSVLLKYWKYHILFWFLIVISFMIFLPFKKNVSLVKETILPIINLQWLVYIIISGFIVKSKIKKLKNTTDLLKWLASLTISVLILWLSYFFIKFEYFVSGSIIFSILFYIFYLFFLFNKKIASEIFQKTKKTSIPKNTSETEKLITELEGIMTTQKIYTNPDLKLPDLARHLNISTHELSRLLNENIGENFTDFINKYRIEEAKLLIRTDSKYTIEGIGIQSGFNSKSAFYKAFKKFTNLTPAKYKSKL